MDFKDILSQLSQLSEATEKTKTGLKHTAEPGGYGRKDDEDDDGKKAKADAPKKGRGRPKKDSDEKGEVKKYDTKGLHDVFGGGKKPKKDIGKTSKKHSLKEWVQEVEQKYVAEAVPPGMKPLAVLDPQNKQAGAGVLTSSNPAVQKMLGGIDPKDVKIVMTTQQSTQTPAAGGATGQAPVGQAPMKEGEKWIQKAIKHPGALRKKLHAKPGEPIPAGKLEKATHSSDPKTARQARLAQTLRGLKEGDIPSDQMDMGAGLGAGRSQATFEGKKPDFPDIDNDKNTKEPISKAAQDKKKKTKVKESMDTRLKAAHHSGKAHALSKQGYNCSYDDMEEARMYHEGYKEGLDECYGQVPIRGGVVDETDMPATVGGMADQAEGLDEMDMYEMDKTEWMKQQARKTPGDTFKAFGQTMHDKDVLETSMFESWDRELNSLLTEYDTIQEGLTVSISKGQQGMPDSVSVTAQEHEADELLSLIKSAGLGLFGDEGGHQHVDGQSSPMSLQPADGGEEGDIDVVGDHDGMMALIKKVTGGAGEPDTVAIGGDEHDHDHGDDYEDEEDHEHTDEERCDECGAYESKCGCDKEMVDEVESEDQMAYEVAEDNPPDSGAEETDAEDQEIAQDNAAASSSGGADDLEEGKCPECGHDPCDCDKEEMEESEQLDEWANEAGQRGTDAQFETDIAFMTKVIAGGLNKEKSTGQTTIPVIPGQKDRMGYSAVNESINDWKKLAGLK